jgi:hypothetical protein
LLFIFMYRRILCLCYLRLGETASHYLSPVISSIFSPSTKAMKIYEIIFALTCIFPVATVASLNRVWVQYEDTEDCRDAFGQYTEGGERRAKELPAVTFDYYFGDSNAVVLSCTDEDIEILEASPCVKSVAPDNRLYLQHLPDSVEEYPRHLQQSESIPYGISMVQADQVWDQGVTGSGVKVCVIDTGIDQDHEDFVTDRLTGLTSSSYPWNSDGYGHGTHCSGTIAAARNNGGVIGVAPDAEIYMVRVFADNGGWIYASGLLDAVYQCQAAGAKIVSMSLGGPWRSDVENLAYRKLFEEGMLLIAAAGNLGETAYGTEFMYPASYDGVISVAAVDSNKAVTSFSQKNNRIDLAAPGLKVLSTIPMRWGGYGYSSGTSMACPHVSGVAALLWSYKPSATAAEIRDAMLQSAEDLGSSGQDDSYGHGLVSAMNALAILPTSVSHEVCQNFAVHARTTVTFDGVTSTIHGGDVGVSPGTSVTGAYEFDGGDIVYGSADFAASVLTAHTEAMAVHSKEIAMVSENGGETSVQVDDESSMDIEIGGKTFTPGTYRSGSAINFVHGTVVTLDGENHSKPEFLFIAGSTLVTAADTTFILKNGAKAENVLWALGSAATLGANSILEGSILAGTAITFGANSTLRGCALAQSDVTFESDGSVDVDHYTSDALGNAQDDSTRHLRGQKIF